MSKLYVERRKSLNGSVSVSGAKNSANKLLYAALYSNQDVTIKNFPSSESISRDINILRHIGAEVEFTSRDSVRVNASGINTHVLPIEGAMSRASVLAVGPLLHRFGEIALRVDDKGNVENRPINRLVKTWQNFGFTLSKSPGQIYITSESAHSAPTNIEINSHIATDSAIVSSLSLKGETLISNAAEEYEIEDLVMLCNLMGASVQRTSSRQLKVLGSTTFGGGTVHVQPDKNEVVFFAALGLLTEGSVEINNVSKESLLSFTSFLNKIGARFEYDKNKLRVWTATDKLKNTNVQIAPAPGFLTDWQALATLLLTQAEGKSLVHDTVFADKFGYTSYLTKMGADIVLLRPSEAGQDLLISDDSYNIKTQGEPYSVAQITGPIQLKGATVVCEDSVSGSALIAACLAAGNSTLINYDLASKSFERLADKLMSLGASISIKP